MCLICEVLPCCPEGPLSSTLTFVWEKSFRKPLSRGTELPGSDTQRPFIAKVRSAAIDGYKLFRRDRRGRRGTGVALYVNKWIDCEDLSLKNRHKQVESLWVRIRDQGNKGNLVVGVYYRLLNQGETIDEACLLQLQEASCSQAIVLLGDFNHPNICWKSSTDKKEMHRQPKQGQVSWEEYRDIAHSVRDGVRKAKVQLELNMARDTKNNKKGFYRYPEKEGQRKCIPPMNTTGKLVTTDEEKAEVLNNFFGPVFTGNLSSHTSRVDGPQGRDWGSKVTPTVREHQV
ncbi:LOW QUALITY PROTEIN: hypothetical protein QYF61_011997 [Mycteria americana]|uniref:Endonuclease/exonuclease/phosphatase domain-containing protein n=1 Tax=Mycteria americana TaxID=33587 RepID=A0AAN7SG56_MYCAM|nr:LOW QUALITY PROTEIN: hypothetical protein QYF61_011997 [Mycteria americana]